jgi:cyanate permease
MNSAGAVAGILSPVAFGWMLDRTGSWTTPFAVSIGLLLLAGRAGSRAKERELNRGAHSGALPFADNRAG